MLTIHRRRFRFMLLINRSPYETTQERSPARYAQSDGSQNPQHTRVTTWIRHCQADRADQWQPTSTQPGDDLSGAVEPYADGLDLLEVGRIGKQPARQVLLDH